MNDYDRKTIWIILLVGNFTYWTYQTKYGTGAKWDDFLDAAAWSGIALLAHWSWNRKY